MLRIKKNDKVMVMVGKDKGKTGKVLKVFPSARRVLIESINMMKKAQRVRAYFRSAFGLEQG